MLRLPLRECSPGRAFRERCRTSPTPPAPISLRRGFRRARSRRRAANCRAVHQLGLAAALDDASVIDHDVSSAVEDAAGGRSRSVPSAASERRLDQHLGGRSRFEVARRESDAGIRLSARPIGSLALARGRPETPSRTACRSPPRSARKRSADAARLSTASLVFAAKRRWSASCPRQKDLQHDCRAAGGV